MIFEKEMITFRRQLQSSSNDYFEGEDKLAGTVFEINNDQAAKLQR